MSTKTISKEAKSDIEELKDKIQSFKLGQIPEERFKAFRLARGVYGQRQQGVQMFRLKLPFGKITADQLETVANLSEQYTNGNLHLTTRQNIQLHYVKLDDSPAIWEALETVGVTSKEACGNTVRNVTASPFAGIDPEEPFDVSPYAQGVFEYFLRNPVCQEMGRKIKIAFSSSPSDSAFTYIHDFGFIPKIKDGAFGFEVIVGGGLGAQAFMGQLAYEFLPQDELIPFIEAGLRVFDRYGERERRHKARLKFLIDPKKGIGLDGFMKLIEEERKSLPYHTYKINTKKVITRVPEDNSILTVEDIATDENYDTWFKTNVFEQKQEGFFAVKVRIPLGDIKSPEARKLADLVRSYAADDIRFTLNQGLLLKYVRLENIPAIYAGLKELGFAAAGFDTLADVTACPGTDTCNLGVTNSTALALELENLVRDEFPHLIDEELIKIKISGCMNSCGQHMVANIGFHGSSIKNGDKVAPAMQVVLGGGVDPDGQGNIAEKVIKIPTKRIPETVREILNNYEENSFDGEYFNAYFRRQGKRYFYDVLKHLGDVKTLADKDYQDWGKVDDFVPEIGVGECAGVMLDLVGTIINDANDRLTSGQKALEEQKWANAIYYAYNTLVIGAKAILLHKDIQCNTHAGIIEDFQNEVINKGELSAIGDFAELVLQINKYEPTEDFAKSYLGQAEAFFAAINSLRNGEADKLVINEFYKA
ncbi:nitrite reductase [Marinoscillum sp.]|uniref:nitrite reductase n=1 Tax=Marinoscillum sp. TaxID=2024838 RepID=UPI003BABFA39